ncbi:MAG: signal peptide peptidase SppA [Prevotella sp.]|nr:signal peptide peptidase SppA [Prevotella sp.]
MKEFFKMTGATVVGIILFMSLMAIISIMSIVGMVASTESTKKVSDNSVLVINLSGSMTERSDNNIIDHIQGNSNFTIGLDNMLNAISKAKDNDKIKGIYIESGMFSADSYASMQAVRKALVDFKKSGKWIVAYGDSYTQATYYIASVADKIYINPSGMIDWHGLSAQPYYLKNLMEKFGVKMQLAKVGTYKSAPETFTADKMSEPNREQMTQILNGAWEQIVSDVAQSRKISISDLNKYADDMCAFMPAEEYLKMKLADGLRYADGMKAEVKKLMELDEDENIRQLTVDDMQNVKGKRKKGEEIAVYYAYGDIVDGGTQGMLSQSHVIDAQVVCKDLERLMEDDEVKAVVIRINSGGGSAYASEQIWHYIELLKAKKPVVVSMGGLAASGGYYMSCNSNWIVAEPTTITGSIGIFGMFPDVSGLLKDKLGVTFDEIKTNKNSGFGTMARPFNDEEMKYLEAYIQRGYELFRKRVADGRKMSIDEVEKIAQGHVWLGKDALKIKLVDQLGGLNEAVEKAAQLAKLKEYKTNSYPAPLSLFDQLSTTISTNSYLDEQLSETFGELYQPLMLLRNIKHHNAIQARIPYYINIQ